MGIRVNFLKKLIHPSRINYRANPVNIYATTRNFIYRSPLFL